MGLSTDLEYLAPLATDSGRTISPANRLSVWAELERNRRLQQRAKLLSNLVRDFGASEDEICCRERLPLERPPPGCCNAQIRSVSSVAERDSGNMASILTKSQLESQLKETWARSDSIFFEIMNRDGLFTRPIDLRNPLVFYLGHLPGFSFIHVALRVCGREPFNAKVRLFRRSFRATFPLRSLQNTHLSY